MIWEVEGEHDTNMLGHVTGLPDVNSSCAAFNDQCKIWDLASFGGTRDATVGMESMGSCIARPQLARYIRLCKAAVTARYLPENPGHLEVEPMVAVGKYIA